MNSSTQPARLRPFRPQPFGRYTLLSHLATGGMGEIYLARLEGAQGFEKLCVIKKILPQLAADTDFVERFVGEARTLVRLSHGSIAQVLDMGLHEDEAYMALEHVDGKDLRKVAARVRDRQMPLPVTFILYTMGRVLDALAYAHRKKDDDGEDLKLVHRDISPQNILISYEGEVKVIDFGLAKSRLSAAKTNPSIILGKFLYMSPEQARHQPVDRRSDLYAVGLCLYELICGKNPFDGIHPGELMSLVANPRIAPLDQVEPLTPPAVTALVAKALAVEPSQRFQTAEEFRGRLQACLMEIDSSAGPESVSRFMRELFSADFQSERRLLASLKDVPRLSTEEVRALASMPDDPLAPKMTHAMLPAKTIRLDGPVEPLSFFPTPRSREGGGPVTDGETRPGVPMDESTRPAFPIEALEEEARARGVRQDTAPSVEVGPEAFVRGGGVSPSSAPIPRAPAMTREVQMTSMPPEAVPPGVAAARALLPSHMRPTELAMPSLGGPSSPEDASVQVESTDAKAESLRGRASEASPSVIALVGAPTPAVPPRGSQGTVNSRPPPPGAEPHVSAAVLPRTGVVVMPAVNVPAPASLPRTSALESMPAVEVSEGAAGYEDDEPSLSDDEDSASAREGAFGSAAPVEELSSREDEAVFSEPHPSGPMPRTASVVMAAVQPPPPGSTPARATSAVGSPDEAAASRSLSSAGMPAVGAQAGTSSRAISSVEVAALDAQDEDASDSASSVDMSSEDGTPPRTMSSAGMPAVGAEHVAPPRSMSSAGMPAVGSQTGTPARTLSSASVPASTSSGSAPARTASAVMAAVSPAQAGMTPSRGMSSLGAPQPPRGATPSRAIPAAPASGATASRSAPVVDEPAVDTTPAHGGQALSPEDDAEAGLSSTDAQSHEGASSELPVLSTEDVGHEESAASIADVDTHPRIHRPSRTERHDDTQPRVAHHADTDPRVTRHDDTHPRVVLDAGLFNDVNGSEDEERSGVSRPRSRRARPSSPGMAPASTARRTGSVSAVRPTAPAPVVTEEEEDESDDDVRVSLTPNEETRRTTMPVRPETRSAERIAKEDTRRTTMPERPERRRKGPLVLVLVLLFVSVAVVGAFFLGPPELRAQVLRQFMPKEPEGPPPAQPLRPSAPDEAQAGKAANENGPPPEGNAAQAPGASTPTPNAAPPAGATPGTPAPPAGATEGRDALDDSFLAPLDTQQKDTEAPTKRAAPVRKIRSARARQLTVLEREWRETNALFNQLNAEHSCVVLGLWCTRYAEVKSEVDAAGSSDNPEALRKVRAMKRYLLQKQKELY
ncbi:serine/threonine-protein kinase [Myxococcus sp. NMCA1]|uniref:serine/threonine-protein kinase n=1 Tax=Myxococcus sp. NMCA1 TaxID=2996785 RepID=UPI002286AB05|nr:serine/threonine protein kinase [Myxococcus sp. NMCA1]WAM25623.1 protein kinase [Myxococcus sp. NMCA1]